MIFNYIFKKEDKAYLVLNQNQDVIVGKFLLEVDGYYYFYIDDKFNRNAWSSEALREIGNKLDEINKPWDDSIYDYFKSHATQ